jgi:uncharacterized protein
MARDDPGFGGGKKPGRWPSLNVLDGPLEHCSSDPLTGFFRNGCCDTGPMDQGSHTLCCVLTEGFLAHQKAVGNDLSTPRPEYEFPGLKPGDRWCVCAARWRQALEAGQACPVVLAATHKAALAIVRLEDLLANAYSADA